MFANNNQVRIIVGVMRADKRKMDEKRVEVGVKEHLKNKLIGVHGLVMWV